MKRRKCILYSSSYLYTFIVVVLECPFHIGMSWSWMEKCFSNDRFWLHLTVHWLHLTVYRLHLTYLQCITSLQRYNKVFNGLKIEIKFLKIRSKVQFCYIHTFLSLKSSILPYLWIKESIFDIKCTIWCVINSHK